MGDERYIFPRSSRAAAGAALLTFGLLGAVAAAGVWYYATPKYTRVGYAPVQPISFSHEQHVGQLGMDCRYCHTNVFESPHANIPAVATCWNCHGQDKGNIKADSPKLAPLREAHSKGMPIDWIRVHKLPDYVYFNHAAHVNRGVSCVSCHGRVDQMPTVTQEQPMSMSWCLDCHRNPAPFLRPNDQVTNLSYTGLDGARLKVQAGINPPTNCTGCHR